MSKTIKLSCLSFYFGLFFSVGIAKVHGQEECLGRYDPSKAVEIGQKYRAALKARDYARLKELKAEKEQLDLWSRQKKTCDTADDSAGDTAPVTNGSQEDSGSADDVNSGADSNGGESSCEEPSAGNSCQNDECERLARATRSAEASTCTYEPSSCADVGFERVNASDIGLSDEDFHDGSFDAELLIDSETGEPMLVFRGTDDGRDWLDNFHQGAGFTNGQYEKAIVLARALNERFPGRLTVSGHSLGGGLASAASLAIGSEATIFNPAALTQTVAANNNLDMDAADTLIDMYYVDGEMLTTIQDFEVPLPFTEDVVSAASAPGERFRLEPPSEDWINQNMDRPEDSPWLPNFIEGPVEEKIDAVLRSKLLHSMITVLESLKERREQLGCF